MHTNLGELGCYQDYFAKGGAAEVGNAITKAVVMLAVFILAADYFTTSFLL